MAPLAGKIEARDGTTASILSKLSLVLGLSVFLAGLHHTTQKLNAQAASAMASLLTPLLLPAPLVLAERSILELEWAARKASIFATAGDAAEGLSAAGLYLLLPFSWLSPRRSFCPAHPKPNQPTRYGAERAW